MSLLKKFLKKLFEHTKPVLIIYNANGQAVYSEDPLVQVLNIPCGVWDTVEADAWSRSFNHSEYTNLCQSIKVEPLSAYAYDKLYQTLQTIMYNDPQMQPSADTDTF